MKTCSTLVFSTILIVSLVLPFCVSQANYCDIREVFSGTCDIKCSRIGVGNTDEPGPIVAQFLKDVYPVYRTVCWSAWMLEITDSAFPNDMITTDWLTIEGELPPITSILIQRSGALNKIEEKSFSTSPALGGNLRTLAIYYNRFLITMEAGLTDGLVNLTSFNWVGNGVLERADSEILFPFVDTIESLHIGDCGMATAEVVANLTGACQSLGSLPSLKILDLGFNPGTGLSTLSNVHLNKLNYITSVYLWHSNIEKFDDITVFDSIASSVQYLDVSNNKISRMKNGTLNSIISALKPRMTLKLGGNQWICDCHLEWLQIVMRYGLGNIDVSDSPVCNEPASQRGVLLLEADMLTECPTLTDDPWELICEDTNV